MTTQDISGGPIALPIDDLLDQPAETVDVATEPSLESPEPEISAEPEQVEEPKKPAKPKDDPVARLKAEVEAARQRETQLLSERDHAAKVAAQKSREAQQATQRAQLSDYDLIANALSSATDKMTALEQQYASAFAEGDGAKAASIQRQMAVLGARVTQLEDGKARMEQMAEQQRRQVEQRRQQPQQQQPRQQGDPFEASIAHFTEASKQWIRAHKDVVTQPGKWNEVIRAHHVAEDSGLDADTSEYFAFIEKKLKLRDDGDDEVQVPQQKPRRSIPAAPPSRDGVIGGISNRKVTLTPAEIQTASDLGMSKEDYASFKLAALRDGKYDHQQMV